MLGNFTLVTALDKVDIGFYKDMRSYDFNCTLEFGEAVDSSNKEY
jgi:hypothetical protein